MSTSSLIVIILIGAFATFMLGRQRSLSVAAPLGGKRHLHSLPNYYGSFSSLLWAIPALGILALWLIFDDSVIYNLVWASMPEHLQALSDQERSLIYNQIQGIAMNGSADPSVDPAMIKAAEHMNSLLDSSKTALAIVSILAGIIGSAIALSLVKETFQARNKVESIIKVFLILSSCIAILTTIGIVLSVLFESLRFFQSVSPIEFLFGTHWSPQIAIRADQVGSSGGFGAIPLFTGTLLISAIAMFVAVPVGLMSAIYLSEYASHKVRDMVKPVLEVLAGVPTVVYGFFAALTVAPSIRNMGESIGLSVSSESALAAGLVMGVMIIPFVSSLSDDVIHAVPQAMRDGSYGLGATRSETIRKVVFPAALPGIVGGVMLAISRAIGETMIVVMAAGLAANLTANPLDAVTTVTVQIVTLLTGDQEFDSPKTLAAFALGLVLFAITLTLNVIALHIVNKYREQYE